jgi:hypothetical protein
MQATLEPTDSNVESTKLNLITYMAMLDKYFDT